MEIKGMLCRGLIGPLLFLCALLAAGIEPAAAQSVVDGSILGRVTDESGGVMPGVSVTVTSPALQVAEMSAITDGNGDFRIAPLPIGTYAVVYTLQGFQTIRHQDIRITAGFNARSDAVLNVGSLEESVTVSGISPVVDAGSTSSVTALTRETLEVNPTGRAGVVSLFQQSPSIRGPNDVGGDRFNDAINIRVYGNADPSKANLVYDGINTTSAGNNAISQYLDYSTFDEVKMQTVANDVEVPNRGIQLQMIVKSGGNEFHGGAYYEGTGSAFSSSNIDADLAAKGIKAGGKIHYRQDGSFELGGRLRKDKLWFYANGRGKKQVQDTLGIFKPDGSLGALNQSQSSYTQKWAWQMTPKQRFVVLDSFVYLVKDDPLNAPSEWTALSHKLLPEHSDKVEWQWVPNGTFVMNAQVARYRISVDYPARPGDVERLDLVTGRAWGLNSSAAQLVEHWRPMGRVSATWIKGAHQMKLGYDDVEPKFYRGWATRPQGNYQLAYNNGVPFELIAYNFPNTPYTLSRSTGIYGADKWELSRTVTLNLGVRYARDAGWVPAQCSSAGTFFTANCTPEIDTRVMKSLSPRLYAAWDVTGNGKTAIKGGWGRFTDWRNQDNFLNLNPNAALQNVYRWHDNNNNGNYDEGEVNLSPTGPDFVTQTGKGNATLSKAIVNPDEPEIYEDQFSASLERELVANLGIRVTGIYSQRKNIGAIQQIGRPPDVYTIANTKPDPGPDGRVGTADDPGVNLTWYEFPTSYVGAQFNTNMRVPLPNGKQTFSTIELAGTKRFSKGWQILASYSATKTNSPVGTSASSGAEVNLNPNSFINAGNRTWEWIARASGAYQLPYGVQASATFEHLSGVPTARTVTLTGGGTIPSITLNAAPIGSLRAPNTNVTNFRAEKRFKLADGKSLTGKFNVFNTFNVNTPTAIQVRSGATYLYPTDIESPRLMSFALSFDF